MSVQAKTTDSKTDESSKQVSAGNSEKTRSNDKQTLDTMKNITPKAQLRVWPD